jgi:hypothetical protein
LIPRLIHNVIQLFLSYPPEHHHRRIKMVR